MQYRLAINFGTLSTSMYEKYGAFSILCTAKSLFRMKTEIRLNNMLEVYYPHGSCIRW